MELQLETIREQQKASWNKFSPGWKKWDEFTMEFLKPYGDEIIRKLNLKDSDVVLDIAAGTGEPGLTIASRLKSGRVIITDLADDMLVIAHDKAKRMGIKNMDFQACDASELPFADNTFDAISCRMGFMFFPDMLMAAKEMVRVLKPGGRIAASVWNGPEKNFWVTAVMGTLGKNIDMPHPPPNSPGLFRCAKSDSISGIFLQAGLKNVTQEEVTGKMHCKSVDDYWTFMTETPAPVAAALSKTDGAMKEKIRREVFQLMKERYPDGNIVIDTNAWVASGQK